MRIMHCKPPTKRKKSTRKKSRLDWKDPVAVEDFANKIADYFVRTSYKINGKELDKKFKVPKDKVGYILNIVIPKVQKRLLQGHKPKSQELRKTPTVVIKEPTLEDRLADIRKRKDEQKTERKNSVILDGFLYLVISPAYPEWIKVGQTTDYEKRLGNYQTASPFADYQMVACKWVENSFEAEQALLTKAKLVFEVKGEWIKASINDLIKEF